MQNLQQKNIFVRESFHKKFNEYLECSIPGIGGSQKEPFQYLQGRGGRELQF